ncbi:MotA/TolQ/ExbB proton channel family protein [uncultured Parasutterella sp.]|uniref:MotA/TolQ/ExbB proton channel family protein n=1 Tax=uncultured Parasutterella sp. TaxID=1263098 RepID=UPI002597C590|nr:MotA/TolQ/ExbB proton channel family protein [uncultured Parasutterella sp.]
MNLTQIYDLIGCTGVVLFIVGIAAVYITVWNIIYLRGVLRSFKQRFRGMENTTAERIRRAYGKSTNPLICIVRDVVTTHAAHSEDIRAEVAYLFHKNFKLVNNALTWLKLIAAVSPLLGLLGTVLGMVRVFRAIAENVSPDPTMLAAGIWTALVTTVMGLVVAIPALMAYYYLTLRIKELRIEAVEYSYRSLESARAAAKYEAEQAAA